MQKPAAKRLLSIALRAGLPALFIPSAACTGAPEPDPPETPLRVPEHGPVPPLPDTSTDPLAAEKAELGRALFHDTRLSGSGQTSCDRCHTAAAAFQDNLITPVPDSSYPNGQPHGHRSTPSMLNIVYAPITRWDGSHTDLVEVMVFPFAEGNMNLGKDIPAARTALKQRLTEDVPGYIPLFKSAFNEDIQTLPAASVWRLTGEALLAFTRRAISRDADFDRWNAGDDSAMNEAAVRGLDVFRGRGKCALCHTGPLFTDFTFHNLSTSLPDSDGERADEGRYLVTGKEEDRGAFLTPTLRSVYTTGPFFHDGAAFRLTRVIEHISSADVIADPNHDTILDPPPELGETDIADLVELMRALRGRPIEEEIGPPEKMP